MIDVFLATKFALALAIGAFIGLERELVAGEESETEKNSQHLAGIRTYSFVGTLGAIAGLMGIFNPLFFVTITFSFIAFILTNYILKNKSEKYIGVTSELAILLTFFIGAIIMFELAPIQLLIAIVVFNTYLLANKKSIKGLLQKIYGFETNALISFLLLAFVIMPFLPNQVFLLGEFPYISILLDHSVGVWKSLGLIEVINPYKIWYLVVLVVGIDFLGYILSRRFGQKSGLLISSLSGGFISSTATTIALTHKSVKSNSSNLASLVVLANASSYLQLVFLLIGIVPSFFFQNYIFLISLLFINFLFGLVMYLKNPPSQETLESNISEGKVFSLAPAIRFALIFLSIKIIIQILSLFFGSQGVIVGSILSAVTGMDATTINIAESVGKTLSNDLAIFIFAIANAVNLLIIKTNYVRLKGEANFAKSVTLTFFSISILAIVMAAIL